MSGKTLSEPQRRMLARLRVHAELHIPSMNVRTADSLVAKGLAAWWQFSDDERLLVEADAPASEDG